MSTYWRMMGENALIPTKNFPELMKRLGVDSMEKIEERMEGINVVLTDMGLYLDSFSDDSSDNFYDWVVEMFYDLMADDSVLYWNAPEGVGTCCPVYWKDVVTHGEAVSYDAKLLFGDNEECEVW